MAIIAELFLLNGGPLQASRGEPHYTCSRELHIAEGILSVDLYADHNLKPNRLSAAWFPASRSSSLVSTYVSWDAKPPANLDFARGEVTIIRHYPQKRFVPAAVSVELRVNQQPPWHGRAAFRGGEKWNISGVSITADWADIRAMAQGREHLYLIVRSRGQIIETHELDTSDFQPSLDQIGGLVEQVNADLKNNRENCDDGLPKEIMF